MFKIGLTRSVCLLISLQYIIMNIQKCELADYKRIAEKENSHYMKKTRLKPYKIQRGRKPWKVQKDRSRMNLQPYKFAETYIKKKRVGGREEERQRNVFICTTDLKLQRGKGQMHASRGEDELTSRKQFYFQDLSSVQE